MDVILDTNVFFALLNSHGGRFPETNAFVELLTYLRRTDSRLVIPRLVVHELEKKYTDLLTQSKKAAEEKHATLIKHLISTRDPEFTSPDITEEVHLLHALLLKPGKASESKIYDGYDKVSLEETVKRGINRIRPANQDGEELRDVVLWLMVLEYAKESKVAFISNDNTFKLDPKQDLLHPDLQRDIADHNVAVSFYTSISAFVTSNALDVEPISPDDVDHLMDTTDAAAQVIERLLNVFLDEGQIVDVVLSHRTFIAGLKHKVGDDSYYVEAQFDFPARLLVEKSIFRTRYFTAPLEPDLAMYPAGLTEPFDASKFGSLSNSTTINVTGPAKITNLDFRPTRLLYDTHIQAQFSIRLVAGAPQSLELDTTHVGTLTLVEQLSPTGTK
jgi:predicted nucleic acid-binding protein